MNALLIRIAADLSSGGGAWNGPVDADSLEFAYVAIPEYNEIHTGLAKPYSALVPALAKFGVSLPRHLALSSMHLDPDFHHLTYGDSGQKAVQITRALVPGDLTVFYAGLRDVRGGSRLVYAIVGVLRVQAVVSATSIAAKDRDFNAHSRRILTASAKDVVVIGDPTASGRLSRCLPIGEYRDRAYRVRPGLLEEWGGLSVRDGYLQRSARIPSFLYPDRFFSWFERQDPTLVHENN